MSWHSRSRKRTITSLSIIAPQCLLKDLPIISISMSNLILASRSSFNIRISSWPICSIVHILRMNHRIWWLLYTMKMRLSSSQCSYHWPFLGLVHQGKASLIVVNVRISTWSVDWIMNDMPSLRIGDGGQIWVGEFGMEDCSGFILSGVLGL